jgi:hypothetical protein
MDGNVIASNTRKALGNLFSSPGRCATCRRCRPGPGARPRPSLQAAEGATARRRPAAGDARQGLATGRAAEGRRSSWRPPLQHLRTSWVQGRTPSQHPTRRLASTLSTPFIWQNGIALQHQKFAWNFGQIISRRLGWRHRQLVWGARFAPESRSVPPQKTRKRAALAPGLLQDAPLAQGDFHAFHDNLGGCPEIKLTRL